MNDQPNSAAAFAEQAFYFIERRRLADARRVIRDGLTQYPQDPDLQFHSAQVDRLEGNASVADSKEGVNESESGRCFHHAVSRQVIFALRPILRHRRLFAHTMHLTQPLNQFGRHFGMRPLRREEGGSTCASSLRFWLPL